MICPSLIAHISVLYALDTRLGLCDAALATYLSISRQPTHNATGRLLDQSTTRRTLVNATGTSRKKMNYVN